MVTAREELGETTERHSTPRPSATRRLDTPALLLTGVAVVVAALVGYWAGGGFTSDPGEAVASRVDEAWATAEPEVVEDVYASEVVMVLNGELIADGRGELLETMETAVNGLGNTYTQIGPTSSYETANDDLLVAGIVEVTGPGHPSGEPLVGFYRVRDDQIVRHVFWQMPQY